VGLSSSNIEKHREGKEGRRKVEKGGWSVGGLF